MDNLQGYTVTYVQYHIFKPCDMASTIFYLKSETTCRQFKPCTIHRVTMKLKVVKDSSLAKPTKVEDVKVMRG